MLAAHLAPLRWRYPLALRVPAAVWQPPQQALVAPAEARPLPLESCRPWREKSPALPASRRL